MAVGESASKIITAVANDAELRERLIAAPESQRRQILDEAGLIEGLTDEDYAELRRLSADPVALKEELLERVTGGMNSTAASQIGSGLGGGTMNPTSNAGGATIAGDVVATASGAALGAGAAIGGAIAIGGVAFGF